MNRIIILLFILCSTASLAREHSEPLSAVYGIADKNHMETIVLPEVDVLKSLDDYKPQDYQAKPLRFAHPNKLSINPQKQGFWQSVPGGEIWQIRFTSKGATDINFGITEFELPKGVTLHFLSFADKELFFDGPYTSDDNRDYKQLWSAPLPGGDVGLELFVPTGVAKDFPFNVTSVNTGFRDVFRKYGGPGLKAQKQGSCNNDVVCPEGDDWRDEIRSVAAYTVGGVDTCTGTLIMDAERTFTPYFLTAFHCGLNSGNAGSVVTIWNYESANCGDLSGGSRMDTVSGAIFRASRSNTDSSLIELSSTPPESYNVHWSGWDRSGNAPSGSVGIHHPGVDEKAISFNNDALTTTNNCIASGTNTHWLVNNWEDGTTEPGSSGSGIWDPVSHQLVGMLSGGTASCNSITSDCYGKFSEAWDDGGADNANLKPWLDPNNTGIVSIDGSDGIPFSITAANSSVNVCTPDDAIFNLTISQNDPTFNETVTFSTANLPGSANSSFSTPSLVPPGTTDLTLSNIGSVTPGSYMFDVTGTSTSETITAMFELVVSDGAPGATTLTSPTDGATGIDVDGVQFTWGDITEATSYTFELATDSGFSNVVDSATVGTNSFTTAVSLNPDSVYYWRVTANNLCGSSVVSSTFSFTTLIPPGSCSSSQIANVLYEYDFESGLNGWTAGNLTGTAEWAETGTSVHSGVVAMFGEDVAQVSDQILTSPQVVIPAGESPVTLSFWNRQGLEENGASGCYDGGILEVSTDGGANFTQVANSKMLTDPYDGPLATNFSNPLGGQDAWCDDEDWAKSIVDFDDYAGQSIVIRYRLATDSSVSDVGWFVDDVRVQSCQDNPCDPAPPIGDPDVIWFNGFQCVQ